MSYYERLLKLGLVDAVIIQLSVAMAYFIRFDFNFVRQYFAFVPYVAVVHVFLVIFSFIRFKLYRRVWQYASVGELIALVKAVTLAELAFALIYQAVKLGVPNVIVPRSVFLLIWLVIILGIGGSRFCWRVLRDSYMKPEFRTNRRRTLIVGAGEAGVLIAKELKNSPISEFFPVAFVDDDKSKWGLNVIGLPILGGRESIPAVVEDYDIQKVLIAIPSASRADISKIIENCSLTPVNIKILPSVSGLVNSNVTINMIREVSVEDLLGRDPVQVDLKGIADYVTDRVVLVTGAGGSIGSELCRQIAPFKPEKLLLLGRGENSIYEIEMELRGMLPELKLETIIADIRDRERMQEVFDMYRPSVVFHAAAHKHVPLMENNPSEAVKNNICGTRNVADCAHEFGSSHFVMISTDKAVNPTSVMGATKRVAEMYIQAMGQKSQTKFVAVRFGNVLGSRGSVIPLFKRQIREGGPVTVTHPEMCRYFMTIPEAVQLVIQAGAFAKGGEIFILDMGKPVKIVDLAKNLIILSGFEPGNDIKIVFSGIRPGEKLYEEILTNEEGITATKHNRIFVGRPVKLSLNKMQLYINDLQSVATRSALSGRPDQIKSRLLEMIPSFQFNNGSIGNVESDLGRAVKSEESIRELKYGCTEVATTR